MAGSFRTELGLALAGCLLGAAAALAQESPTEEPAPEGSVLSQELELDRSTPITLDADASEFDRQSDRLRFRGLHIRQGDLAIHADEAQASRLDFEDTVWTFFGNVLIENSTTRVWSDDAEVSFENHQVSTAILRGSPARFEQRRPETGELTRGRAEIMDYSLETGIIQMSGDAWVSDGANEVTGPRIAYDAPRDLIKAVGDGAGQVRMRIVPPDDRESAAP